MNIMNGLTGVGSMTDLSGVPKPMQYVALGMISFAFLTAMIVAAILLIRDPQGAMLPGLINTIIGFGFGFIGASLGSAQGASHVANGVSQGVSATSATITTATGVSSPTPPSPAQGEA